VSRDPQLQRLAAHVQSVLQLQDGTPVFWGRLRDTLACMVAEGHTEGLPAGTLQLLPLIDTIATKLKVEVRLHCCLVRQRDKLLLLFMIMHVRSEMYKPGLLLSILCRIGLHGLPALVTSSKLLKSIWHVMAFFCSRAAAPGAAPAAAPAAAGVIS
jgi:hypothetical protein